MAVLDLRLTPTLNTNYFPILFFIKKFILTTKHTKNLYEYIDCMMLIKNMLTKINPFMPLQSRCSR